jgi:hypothetical protein
MARPVKKKSKVEKFREAAREAGTDESEERFNATLKDWLKFLAQYAPDDVAYFGAIVWDGIDAHWIC